MYTWNPANKIFNFFRSRNSSWNTCKDYVKIGGDTILGPGSSIDVKFRPLFPHLCVEIGENSQIFGHLVVQRPEAYIKIGKRTQIGNSYIIAAKGVEIGDDVLMAWGITLMDNDSHSLIWENRKNDAAQCAIDYKKTPEDFTRNKDWSHVQTAPIIIEEKAWIGFDVAILKGVCVGEGAIIGAKSVVTSDVEPYTMVAGNPARFIKILPGRR